ncbi:MAG: hypothetical protein ACOVP1_06925 [Bacteroidia bacterium]
MNNQKQHKPQPKPKPHPQPKPQPQPQPQPNWPSTVPHHPSGPDRDNNPPKSSTMIPTKKK